MRYFTFILLASCLFLVGCGGDSIKTQLAKYSEENIQKATLLYTIYVSLNQYSGPDNIEQMTSFYQSSEEAQKRLDTMGIDINKIDEYLVGRDGEQYQFIWGVQKNPFSRSYPVCYEKDGFEGTYEIGISGGRVHIAESEDEVKEIIKQENYEAPGESNEYNPNSTGNN